MIHIKIEDKNMNKKADTQNLSTIYENLIHDHKVKKKDKTDTAVASQGSVGNLMDFVD